MTTIYSTIETKLVVHLCSGIPLHIISDILNHKIDFEFQMIEVRNWCSIYTWSFMNSLKKSKELDLVILAAK